MAVHLQSGPLHHPSKARILADKARLRRKFLSRREALRPEAAETHSQAIVQRFWRLQAVRNLQKRLRSGSPVWLSCYVDFGLEVRTRALLRKALARGYRVAVPVVPAGRGAKLFLSEIKDLPGGRDSGPMSWVRTAFGVLEPRHPRPVETENIDFFVVPGLAFDGKGIRLGFGKGYYDGLLASARADAQRIGLAFSCQMEDRIPRDEWDIPMHRVVTEVGVIRCDAHVHRYSIPTTTNESPEEVIHCV